MAPAGGPRPFTVIDDGYQDRAVFPDMARLAGEIAAKGVVPGVWIRPLRAAAGTPAGQLLPMSRFGPRHGGTEGAAYDPTVPEGRAAALAVVREARGWGYRLIKHDFTTWELLGQWGFQMGASPTRDGWSFHDRSQTNAEIIAALYWDIRVAAGDDRIVLGCNTVGHLAAGTFDAQRTGDDVSGKDWERTRRMGVNTLAFRLPQHGRFFSVDADCVPITAAISWVADGAMAAGRWRRRDRCCWCRRSRVRWGRSRSGRCARRFSRLARLRVVRRSRWIGWRRGRRMFGGVRVGGRRGMGGWMRRRGLVRFRSPETSCRRGVCGGILQGLKPHLSVT